MLDINKNVSNGLDEVNKPDSSGPTVINANESNCQLVLGDEDKLDIEEEYDNISFSEFEAMYDKVDDLTDKDVDEDEDDIDGRQSASSLVSRNYLPGVEFTWSLEVEIVDATKQPQSHRLNPYLYIIELTHGTYKWTIKRR